MVDGNIKPCNIVTYYYLDKTSLKIANIHVSNVFGKDFKDNLLIFLKYSSLSLKMALKIEYMLKFSCHITLWFLHIYML